ncbi:hypothetical protein GCM10022212_17230 [Actimicrobium antarcticum]|uniref:Uncharacterized protein n=1 Tax=Actimicrobium antarcticum TaxID=1051899 RepID=A0ABP7T4K0_9BURK
MASTFSGEFATPNSAIAINGNQNMASFLGNNLGFSTTSKKATIRTTILISAPIPIDTPPKDVFVDSKKISPIDLKSIIANMINFLSKARSITNTSNKGGINKFVTLPPISPT